MSINERPEFAVAMRGYDRQQVDDYVQVVVQYMEELDRRASEAAYAAQRRPASDGAAAAGGPSVQDELARVTARARAVSEEARAEADRVVAAAWAEAQQIVQAAKSEAQLIAAGADAAAGVARGAGTAGSRGAGTAASRGAGTAASRGAGTAASRGAGTAASRGAGTAASRGAGTAASRGAGTAASRGAGTAASRGANAPGTGPLRPDPRALASTSPGLPPAGRLEITAPQGGMREAFLSFRDGSGHAQVVALRPPSRWAIGRARSSEVSLGWDSRVSRWHAQIERVGSEWWLIDDGMSTNGTYVNEERLDGRRRLSDGDVVRAGQTELIFSCRNRSDVAEGAVLRPFES